MESSQYDEYIGTVDFVENLFGCLKQMKRCLADLIAASPLPKKDFRYALPLFRFLQSVELVEEIRVYQSAELLARFSKTLEEAVTAVGDL